MWSSQSVCDSNKGISVPRNSSSYVDYVESLINSHNLKMNNLSHTAGSVSNSISATDPY